MADQKKDIVDDDLIILVEGKLPEGGVELKNVQIIAGDAVMPSATVHLKVQNEEIQASAMGAGSVDAAFRAVDQIMSENFEMDEFLVQSMGSREDEGKVHIRLKHKDQHYIGFGVHRDVIIASVKAYVDAINKITALKRREKKSA
jgi:2-isopropylmalate synthase